ncbi:hypothetical protein DH2020_019246 [Rehmannia glutinosa]|uniref:JmjC domain-containing protein n=1 Tax=Rehmannia glutinosa TaxID=99300 RepID=A0ABR0WPQ2_REHGL
MGDWRACKDWVFGDGKPNLRFFSTHFGGSRVQVADCGTREFTDQKRVEMSVSEFIDNWIKFSGSDNGGADGKSLLYLKDWHFVKEYPDYVAYTTPIFFLDDWLNIYLDKYCMHNDPGSYQERNEISCSDYRFVYMGAKGTWTPLHADVFRSYSWSANVCGRKQWRSGGNVLRNKMKLSLSRVGGTIKSIIWSIVEDTVTTEVQSVCYKSVSPPLVPPTGQSVMAFEWDLLLREYNEAKGYIEDIKDICDDFEGLCQRNLAANAGMP